VSGEQHEVAYADVAKALVQIEFNRKTDKAEKKDD
jgi:ribosome maturation factor RimP